MAKAKASKATKAKAKKSPAKVMGSGEQTNLLYELDVGGKTYIGTTATKGRSPEATMKGRIDHYWHLANAKTRHFGALPSAMVKLKDKNKIDFKILGKEKDPVKLRETKQALIAKRKPELNIRYTGDAQAA